MVDVGALEDPLQEAMEIVETPICQLRLDHQNGNLVGLTWKNPTLEVIQEPRLGENFRLLLPLPDYEANYFVSSEQNVSRIEKTTEGATCVYETLRNVRETLNVNVQYHIRAVGEKLEFTIEVDNPTEHPLAEVFFGIVGGQQGLGKRQDTESMVPGFNTNLASSIFTNFRAGGYGGGNLGIRYDAAGFTYPGIMTMGWMEFFNHKTNLGIYYANHDPESRLTGLYFELRPFTKSAALGDNWPTSSDVPAGEPIGLTMGWLKFPYLKNGTFNSGPVALQVHNGDWHEGSELYREWFDQHFQVKRSLTWLRKEMAWQSIIISNCEDVRTWKFKDLPKLAADAKKYGVTTFEILGWDIGGIDRGYPQYRPDPRLGTHEEFQKALAEVREIGVHPLIFANIQEADTATLVFKEKLHQFVVMGRWAPDLRLFGWGEGTISARMGLTSSNMTLISPAHQEVRKLLVDHFTDLARDGAEGLQLDKTVLNSMLDFNPHLHTSPDRSMTEEMLATFREILVSCREINPNFALASEIYWDRAFPFVDVSYARMNEVDMESAALRYTFPEWTSTICAESPGDFNVISNGMRYGLVWAIQPRHYNDSMDELLTRPLSRFVQELIRIRMKHKDILFHGRFRDSVGAEVKGGKDTRYSVFEGMDKVGKACVVVNYGNEEANAEVTWPGGEGQMVEILKPFQPDTVEKLPVKIQLTPRTCAVVVLV
ncbi:MAG: DUF6259 domain-containing protein [Candidatus Bathyarchaeota archaeon]|nr:DUF6259 domain-containing protein [Candidatus Bathyarchaeota archaeon]